jgi:hypothetical protein
MTLKELVDLLNANKDDKLVFVGKLPLASKIDSAAKTDAAVVLKTSKVSKNQSVEDALKVLVIEGGDALPVTVDGVGPVLSAAADEGVVKIKLV